MLSRMQCPQSRDGGLRCGRIPVRTGRIGRRFVPQPSRGADRFRHRYRSIGHGVDKTPAAMLTSHSSAAYRAAFCDPPPHHLLFRPFAWTRELPIVDRLELARFVGGWGLAWPDSGRFRIRRPNGQGWRCCRARLGAEGVFYSDGHATERVFAGSWLPAHQLAEVPCLSNVLPLLHPTTGAIRWVAARLAGRSRSLRRRGGEQALRSPVSCRPGSRDPQLISKPVRSPRSGRSALHPSSNRSVPRSSGRLGNGTNSLEVFEFLSTYAPDLVFLFGSAIVRPPLLDHFAGRMINMHLGLSPYYRGSATNFWPLVDGLPECVGVTVHHATAEVDGGAIPGPGTTGMHRPTTTAIPSGARAVIAGGGRVVRDGGGEDPSRRRPANDRWKTCAVARTFHSMRSAPCSETLQMG